ncbi:MAG: hypothetical protein U9N00_05025, partial [Candidatus Bipolaricaulota bacterium]|nr:hypothetical protein [Candidatus Bipolaricaulota bacterium]
MFFHTLWSCYRVLDFSRLSSQETVTHPWFQPHTRTPIQGNIRFNTASDTDAVFLIPFGLLFSLIIASPLSLALFVLVLALLALGIVFGIALGVIGNLVDLVIVLGLIGIVWNWPRGAQGRFTEKLRLAYHRLRATLYRQVRQFTAADLAVTLVVILIAVVLSLSSGLIHFLLTLVIILAVVGIVWKW